MALVFIPPAMRTLTGGKDRVTVPGSSLRQIVNSLEAAYPGMRDRLIVDGNVRHEIAVAIDGDVVEEGALLQSVREESEVHFLPSIAGGC